jgi:hypothetical protein
MVMKLQRQQTFYDCFLATIAMLANKLLSEVAQKANELSDGTFTSLVYCKDATKFWICCSELANFYNLPNVTKTCLTLTAYPTVTSLKDCDKVQPFATDIDLSGKGYIGVHWKNAGHAMAFEDGMIFDPNADEPMTLVQWKKWTEFAYLSLGGVPEQMIVTKESD